MRGRMSRPGERMVRRRVAILISGRGSNMAALVAVAQAADFPAEIALVLSNRPDAKGLAAAQAAGIAAAVVDHVPFGTDRAAFERALQRELAAHRIELICLAGFMRLFTPEFVTHWQGHMLNIHPALLPAIKGLDTHARALAAGVKIHGATVHFVVPEMDAGPIIAQGALASWPKDACVSRTGAAASTACRPAIGSCSPRRSSAETANPRNKKPPVKPGVTG
jgi:phosphoribosylglycinamide formyltransferase-1